MDVGHRTLRDFEVERVEAPTPIDFDAHAHTTDQLAWMTRGAMVVEVHNAAWHLRRDHFAWIPAGTLHQMSVTEPGTLINLYSDVAARPSGERWSQPCTVFTDPVVAVLLHHLLDAPRTDQRRSLVHELLADVLCDTDVRNDAVAVPSDPRALAVATAILDDPSDTRDLATWARSLRVSEKTLSRAFVAETGATFRQWRQQARLHRAAAMLADSHPVARVAAEVGYRSTSSFIVAFTERYATTPGRYARAAAR